MKCKLPSDSTAVRYDCSCDNTYNSQHVSDWNSKTPVLIDDLGRTWCFHQALVLGSPVVTGGYMQPGREERKSSLLKPEHPWLLHKTLEPACTAYSKQQFQCLGGAMFFHAPSAVTCSTMTWTTVRKLALLFSCS